MSKLMEQFEKQGDKENSSFFNEYLPLIYDRREQSGLDDLISKMRAVVIQVGPDDGLKYLEELYLMTPYRFHALYENETHRIYVLRIKPEQPDYIIVEPLSEDYYDNVSCMNGLFPRGCEKRRTKYLGEIFQVSDLAEVVKVLQSQQIRFQKAENVKNKFIGNENFRFTEPSYFTANVVGYTESDLLDYEGLGLGKRLDLDADELERLEKMDALQKHFGLLDLIYGIDHLATRVFCGSREDAILEFLTMSNYYYWGSFNIEEMNSSTNVCRNPQVKNELHSPAKVFTANNTPFYVNSVKDLASPTEDFVRNFGRRMHHIAYEVEDGETGGLKNIDYVVGKLVESDIPFLAKVIGECKDIPDLKQIFSKASKHSVLITEYDQRCKNFGGFFTKTNVAELTKAAGEDEGLKTMVGDG
ncbi:hypothetical protein JKY72_00165 [Candidatus Gracilibacteria bacterium]|nr:hypothetical protein [Candidatus Gracilibacteria bacterium]